MRVVLDNAVRRYRLAAGKSTYEIGLALGIHPSTITLIENGRRNASDEMKASLAAYFKVPMTDLFYERNADKKKARGVRS